MKTIKLEVGLCFLLGLAGVFPGAQLTFAQSDDICAKPAGFPDPPADLVTAAQVDSGDGTLAAFVEGYRQYSSAILGMNGSGYLGCVVTQEGPFNSGSTYIVTLTPNGRVAVHGRDVYLSGGATRPRDFRANPPSSQVVGGWRPVHGGGGKRRRLRPRFSRL